MKNYWAYRIMISNIDFFQKELERGVFRQGWGYHEGQNLRNITFDAGAKKHLKMFNKVKKGDILLVTEPSSFDVTIVEAAEDWDKGYQFIISKEHKDYGHTFPVRKLKTFPWNMKDYDRKFKRKRMKTNKFWNINQYSEEIEKFINNNENLINGISRENRLLESIQEVYHNIFGEKEKKISDLNEKYSKEEWEELLLKGLNMNYNFYNFERVEVNTEEYQRTYILIKIRRLVNGYQYGACYQINYDENIVLDELIKEIDNAEQYWKDKDGLKLLRKSIVVMKAKKSDHRYLVEYSYNRHLIEKKDKVNFIFAKETYAGFLQKRFMLDFLTLQKYDDINL